MRGHVEEGDDSTAETAASGILRLRLPGSLRRLATFRDAGKFADDPHLRRRPVRHPVSGLALAGLRQALRRSPKPCGERASEAQAARAAMRNVDGNGATTRMKTLTDDQRIVYLYWRTVKSHAICGDGDSAVLVEGVAR